MTDAQTTDIPKAGRDQSSIAFPYVDLEDAISVARALHDAGGVPLDRDQLAAQMNQAPGGGNFSIKTSGARLFGLMETSQGKYSLTGLGYEILDSAREKHAKATAFLNVPLYRRAYEEWKGKTLPPRPLGLENAFVQFGVAPKQKDKARHVFDRSARIAGFFPNGQEDRLVVPVTGAVERPQAEEAKPPAEPPMQHMGHPPAALRSGINPFIQGLLDELPERGVQWATVDQAMWLTAAAAAFRMIYRRPEDDTAELAVTVKPKGSASPA